MKNKPDVFLEEKLARSKIPEKIVWKPQQIPKELTSRQKQRKAKQDAIARKTADQFFLFWDVVLDDNPQYCFVCGYYIRPSLRSGDPSYVQKRYKNGDYCHTQCFYKNITVDDAEKKLNPESLLICHLDLGLNMESNPVCRQRVLNTPKDILIHYLRHRNILEPNWTHMENHGSIEEHWQNNYGIDWKDFRNLHFLKPTGQPFKIAIVNHQ